MILAHTCRWLCTAWAAACLAVGVQASEQTVGLFVNTPVSFPGYTLFAPMGYTTTYLIDNDGQMVHAWTNPDRPRLCAYLRKDGLLVRTVFAVAKAGILGGGGGGRIQLVDWNGDVVWDYSHVDTLRRQHHDVASLPNGNVLIIAWEKKTALEAIAAGRDPALLSADELWSEGLVEIRPMGFDGGEIVWEWHAWDHLIQDYDPLQLNYGAVRDHPELIDLNFPDTGPNPGQEDWLHINAVAYNERLDQVMVTVNRFREIWVLDHSTTSAEAASHAGGVSGRGGDILYRWGNPRAYRRGTAADRRLFGVHDGRWIADSLPNGGNILMFNNGNNRPDGVYSSVDEIAPPIDSAGQYLLAPDSTFGPSQLAWRYTASPPEDFAAQSLSGAQRMPNGNTLICHGPNGDFFEVDPVLQTIWRYVNPVTADGPIIQGDPIPTNPSGQANSVFKIERYSSDYPGLAGRDLTPQGPIEQYLTGVMQDERGEPLDPGLLGNYPNPFNETTRVRYRLAVTGRTIIDIYNIRGQRVLRLVDRVLDPGSYAVDWDGTDARGRSVASGVYLVTLTAGGFTQTGKILLLQ